MAEESEKRQTVPKFMRKKKDKKTMRYQTQNRKELNAGPELSGSQRFL